MANSITAFANIYSPYFYPQKPNRKCSKNKYFFTLKKHIFIKSAAQAATNLSLDSDMTDLKTSPKKLISMRFEQTQLEKIDKCALKMFQYSGVKMDRTKLTRILLDIALECQPHLDHSQIISDDDYKPAIIAAIIKSQNA